MPSILGDDDLELEGASATFKLDDSTFGAITRGIDGISSLTLPLPDGSPAQEWVDTGVNLPANSVLRYIFIKKTTPGANGSDEWVNSGDPGNALWVANFGLAHDNDGTPTGTNYDEYYGDYAAPGDYSGGEVGYNLQGTAGDPDWTGHWVINGLANDSVKAAYNYAKNLWLKIEAVGNASSGGTAPVVGVFVVYDTFDVS